jgi:prepilin-type N-terminal cleavage/methylation domain-containing protein
MIHVPRLNAGQRRGFTLIEVVVAMAVFAIFMIGILNLLDTSTNISEIEKALSDTQENVRFAAYHIMRTTRMTGGAGMKFADSESGPGHWIAGELLSNQSGSVTTPYPLGSIDVLDGTDVLTVRGFFETPPLFVTATAVNTSLGRIEVLESAEGRLINPGIDALEVTQLAGRGLVFMGELDQREYAVGQVGESSTLVDEAPNRTLNLIISDSPSTWWTGLNETGGATAPPTEVFQVGILDSYTYFVDPEFRLMRLRADGSAQGATLQPVAVNIGGLQVALGVDTDSDGQVDVWQTAPTAAGISPNRVVSMRITVLGRTPIELPGWEEPAATFAVAEDTQSVDAAGRRAKWRRVEVVSTLRNYMFSGGG